MEPKKNPKVDLSKRSLVFLQLGLILVLLTCYFAIQWKSFGQEDIPRSQLETGALDEEAIPITILPTPPPPVLPPPPPSDQLEVIDDDTTEEEGTIESTESTAEPIAEPKDIVEAPTDHPVEPVPFILIESVPIFPGCENLNNNEERKNCMSEKINQLINRRFNKNLGPQLQLSGVNRVNVLFKIDTQGNIIDIQSRAPHPRLEEEAIRVINSLPSMQPGKQRGKPVPVIYSIPIIFEVQE